MKITTIIGARPQFIKAAVVSRALRQIPQIEEEIIHTGQHYDSSMSAIFFDELGIPHPACNLGIGGGSHGKNTGRMIEAIETILLNDRPDYLLVYGDTDSTLAGALAATKLHIPVVHIEAGLRSYNRQMPEEINRVLTDHIADLLFAPSQRAVENLTKEGIAKEKIHLVGDVMYDAALFYAEQAETKSNILSNLAISPKEYILATIHRQENTDDKGRLTAITRGLSRSTLPVILPLHPRTAKNLNKFNLTLPPSVQTIEPVGYLDMVMLEKHSALIITDSGGVQKEAFFHKIPCITCRTETEWTELVDLGVNRLTSPVNISDTVQQILSSPPKKSAWMTSLYGDGNTAEKIIQIIT